MALLAVMPTVWSAVIACVLVGAASVLFLTTGNATVQLAADPGYRGRVKKFTIPVPGPATTHSPGEDRQRQLRRA